MALRATLGLVPILAGISPACSSQPLPPNIPCDAGCGLPITVSAEGPIDDASTGACAPASGDSPCVQCAKASCCDTFAACFGSQECSSLTGCESNCDDTSCVASCQAQFPSGLTPLTQIDTCLDTFCTACTELGVGDPCAAAQGSCETGLTCNGLWCTKACASSADCAGLGPSGGNLRGEQNACVGTATSGDVCFPGCGLSSSDCASFPAATCSSTTSVEGATVAICESVSDAGPD